MNLLQMLAILAGLAILIAPAPQTLVGWGKTVGSGFLRAFSPLGGDSKDQTLALVALWQAYYLQARLHGCGELVTALEALFPHNVHRQEDSK